MRRTLSVLWLLLAACAPAGEPGLPPNPGLGHVAAKLAADSPVRIAYLGGSITEVRGWRPLTTEWLRERSRAPIEEVNAGVAGTDSAFGAFRLEADVLAHEPDLVFVEFAVNDRTAPPGTARQALEGIVRKLWRADPEIDVLFVYSYAPDFAKDFAAGREPGPIAEAEQVARHYGIPSVSVAREVQRRLDEGSAVVQRPRSEKAPEPGAPLAVTFDGVHPTREGHRLYAQVIADRLSRALEGAAVDRSGLLAAKPLDAARHEDSTWVPVESVRRIGSWRPVVPKGARNGRFLEASEPGSALEVSFRGRSADLLVWLDAHQEGLVAVQVDDGPPAYRRIRRAPNVARIPGQRVAQVASGLDPTRRHRVRVSLVSPAENRRALRTLRAAAFLVRGEPERPEP